MPRFASLLARAAQPLALTALALAAGASHATITVYTNLAAWTAAVGSTPVGVDTFNNVASGNTQLPQSLTRSAGSTGYTVSSGPVSTLYGAGSSADRWLSTDQSSDLITFSGFSAPAKGVGGLFFGSDVNGLFLAGATLHFTVTDANGTVTDPTPLPFTNPTTSTFIGFVSTNAITSFSITTDDPSNPVAIWPTVNDLRVAAVPEPATLALWLAGVAAVGSVARRRRG